MSVFLRQYEPGECGQDGYPLAWHKPFAVHEDGSITFQGSTTHGFIAIKDYIRERDGHRCLRCGHPYMKGEHESGEWSSCAPECRHANRMEDTRWRVALDFDGWAFGAPTFAQLQALDGERDAVIVQSRWRILTVHHLDEDKANCRWWNLVSLCQRCHLRMQRGVVMGRVYSFEHSDWFKPFAAAFYAWKYLGEDLTREEVDARMSELLALEHRFTQEVLL